MRPRTRLTVTTLLALLAAYQAAAQASRTKPTPAALNVTPCEVLAAPAKYSGRAVRFTAVYRQSGEDFAALECPGCRGLLWQPRFEDSFDSCTPREVRKRFRLDVTLVVTVVGRFDSGADAQGKPYQTSFRMACAEKAESVGRGAASDLDLPRVRRLANCATKGAGEAEEKKNAPANLP